MRYYAARQRLDSQWDWTVRHDGIIRASHPCNGDESCNHKTKEEAERHFYHEEIKKTSEMVFSDEQLNQCSVKDCKEYTHKALKTPLLFQLGVLLCDSHRNNNGLMLAHPYNPGMELWVS